MIDDITRFAALVGGTVHRWDDRQRADMSDATGRPFLPVGAAWSKYLLIVGFNM